MVGAIILFVWNAISWMALPFHNDSLKTIPEAAIDFQGMQAQLQEDGIYHYPSFDTESMSEKLASGPRIPFLVYIDGPTEIFDPAVFAKSFIMNLVSSILLFTLLAKMSDTSRSNIIAMSLVAGLLIGFVSDLPQMNWYMFPLSYTLINVFDHIIGFSLMGIFFSFFRLKAQKET